MSLTLVSALYDLAGRERNPDRHTVARYLEAGEFLFALDADLVVFADSELAPAIEARRRDAGRAARTRVVTLPLEELAAHALADRIAAARRRHPLRNGNPAKDTPLYAVLQWAKFELVTHAARLDPFTATHLAWIDLGLPARPHPDDRVFERAPDRVRLLMMRPFAAAELADERDYYAYLRGHVAAGYVSGPRRRMLRLCGLFAEEARASLSAGFAPSEEQLLPVLSEREPALFEFHHGDYGHILSNYERLRGGGENLLFQLRVARDAGLQARGLEICQALIASHRDGIFECPSALLAELLDECFLAAWHGGGEDRALAAEVACVYAERVRADSRFREVFLRDEVRVRSNFDLLGGAPWGATVAG